MHRLGSEQSPEEKFLALYDSYFERLIGEIVDAGDGDESWSTCVFAATNAALRFLAAEPHAAEVLTLDVRLIGPAGFSLHHDSAHRLAELLRGGRACLPSGVSLPTSTEYVLVGGAIDFLSHRVLTQGVAGLPSLVPELAQLILTPYLGVERAREVAAAELQRGT